MSRRRIACAVLVAAVIATPAAAGAKAFSGVVADVSSGTHIPSPAAGARIANLNYNGGPVLHSNRTHLIFWTPSGSGLSFPNGYQSLVVTFMRNVAADSRKATNVYGLSGQYYDSTGRAVYNSAYAGAVLDSDHLPANGCAETPLTGPGWVVCLNDSQLESEIAHMIAVHHLPTGSHDVYFLVTPSGLGSCLQTGPDNCALGGAGTGYCGYHSQSIDNTILYAVIPYNAVPPHCQSENPRPNHNPADPALSTISHEHSEMVTDPLSDGWIDSSGQENGDLCITTFGNNIGGSLNGAWNEAIHGGHYYLQEEYSNFDGQCAPRAALDRISFTSPRHVKVHKQASFAARGTFPQASLNQFTWFFGAGRIGHGRRPTHTYKHPGAYRVVLRSTDSWGNWAFDAKLIRVTAH